MATGLTALAVQRAQARAKAYKLGAGGGLYLLVEPSGRKYWRWKYRFAGRERKLSLGVYPQMSLTDARRARDEARTLHAQGVDPGVQRQVAKAVQRVAAGATLESVLREWFELKREGWAASHAVKVLGRLEKDVLPALGHRAIDGVTIPEVLAVLRKIEARGAIDTARRVRQHLSHVFVYAAATQRCSSNPAADLQGVLRVPVAMHFPTITDPLRIGALLRAIEHYDGAFSTRAMLRLAPMVFVRPSELRLAEWPEFDLDAALWTVPAVRLKMRQARKASAPPHLVPLAHQAVALLRDLRTISGGGRYVFPSTYKSRAPLSANTINAALAKMGFKGELVGHGLRHMASTQLNELGWPADVIERQLAHRDGNKVRAIYNQARYLQQRRDMMQAWADYLLRLREGLPSKRDTAPVV